MQITLLATALLAGATQDPRPPELNARELGVGRATLVGDLDGGGRSELVVLADSWRSVALLVRGEGGGAEVLEIEPLAPGEKTQVTAAAVEIDGAPGLALLLTSKGAPAVLELRTFGPGPTRTRHPVATQQWIERGELHLVFALASLAPERAARGLGLEWSPFEDSPGPECAAGDFDGDGQRELAFVQGEGALILEADRSGEPRRTAADFASLEAGPCIACPGDLDADGADDLVVATADSSCSGVPEGDRAGLVVAYSGRTGEVLWRVNGVGATLHMGHGLAAPGDVNADGVPDVVTAVHHSFASKILFLSGRDGRVLRRGPETNHFPEIGRRQDAGGDWDGDGVRDLVTTAYSVYMLGAPGQGAYVLSGKSARPLAEVVLGDGEIVEVVRHVE